MAESIQVGTGRPTLYSEPTSKGVGLFLQESKTLTKKCKIKTVGKLDAKFCRENSINEYSNMKIVQSFGLVKHVQKHINDFTCVNSYNKTMSNIDKIINNPYYRVYDPVKNSIKYYGKIDQYICVVVNLTNTEAYVSTLYPVNKKTIDKLKK